MMDWDERFKQAEAAHRARKTARQDTDGMVRIGGTRSELSLPPDVFERLGGVPTYGEAVWACPDCEESPEPRQYANGFVPGKCSCQLAQLQREKEERTRLEQWRWQQERMRKQCALCYSWLGPEWDAFGLDEKTLENFEMDPQADGFCTAVEYAQQPHGNLVMWSDQSYGTGKTHLAAAIVNYQLARGVPARFTTAQGFFDALSARMDDHHGYSDLLTQASNTPLLVIDDLDAMHLSSSTFKQSIFFEVLNKRYLRGLPTVITTNAHVEITHDDVPGISEYIGKKAASRLCDRAVGGLTVVEMNGEDYRRRER